MNLLRLFALSIAICGFVYVPAVLGFAKVVVPEKAVGSLVTTADGKIVGSRLVAQAFTTDRYFHPRPSACDYNGAGAAGSNLSPTSPELTQRAEEIIATYPGSGPIPADLITASGSGLDPHITRAAAIYQIPRVSAARNMAPEAVEKLIPSGNLVNVLELNLALDR
ncbi:potassium-transporting ATPase subunit C [Luteolibacter pohnpeiensis]|uniref:Potassium-transporting ATPase KdpC subunit n=1 Tax=Luteolibacter pohnpeiensis TaxID=454153 RepID=A0A934SES9_9BACT|nr:potassium-transporting ATPase subunit C [Luteolibacter pohnpeiensis]MBK1884574.1 potassium-transporting ATPase subunit C [Luteolibacter pohnpeiensis]